MSLQLGQIAPDFEQQSTQGNIRLHEWLGNSWGIFFSHPKNFTPVCTTELAEVARLKPEWDKRGIKPLGLSVDDVKAHNLWEKDIEETQGHALNFPMLADTDKKVIEAYGVGAPLINVRRSVFVVDGDGVVRFSDRKLIGATFVPADKLVPVLQQLG